MPSKGGVGWGGGGARNVLPYLEGGGGADFSNSVGTLTGGCHMSILRNDNVICLYLLFFSMSNVEI